ncbi:hypothetical protein [Pseudofrankia sp. BMG5.37]|uniref:hypothetical protein n=1 Tax=Pseudofrankia sp. BMG5.37 TaxID=3050035 RepID=UPI0008DA5E9C|nr:hypothetical protein [Pseudofrankia sp. BMG5.37]
MHEDDRAVGRGRALRTWPWRWPALGEQVGAASVYDVLAAARTLPAGVRPTRTGHGRSAGLSALGASHRRHRPSMHLASAGAGPVAWLVGHSSIDASVT